MSSDILLLRITFSYNHSDIWYNSWPGISPSQELYLHNRTQRFVLRLVCRRKFIWLHESETKTGSAEPSSRGARPREGISKERLVKEHCILASGFRREVDDNSALLGCYAASSGNSSPTFRDILPVRCYCR
jgi:hypothetical protein